MKTKNLSAHDIYNILVTESFFDWYKNDFQDSILAGQNFSVTLKKEIEELFNLEDSKPNVLTRKELLARLLVPTQGKYVRFSSVTQNGIYASPLNWEAAQYPNQMIQECKDMVKKYNLSVFFSQEVNTVEGMHTIRKEFHPIE